VNLTQGQGARLPLLSAIGRR